MIRFACLSLLVTASLTLAVADAAPPAGKRVLPPANGRAASHDGISIFVRYRGGSRVSQRGAARAAVGGSVVGRSKLVAHLERVALPPGLSVDKALAILERHPAVAYAHPNYRIRINQTLPDDTYFAEQWALHNTGQASAYDVFAAGTADADIDWPEARTQATGAGVVVAVLDTGADYRHTDLAPNLWQNEAELSGEAGVDDDGNGYTDDVRGWDFVNNDADPMDGHYHGTHVAGTIAAVPDNGKGVAGIMTSGKVMVLKVLDDNGDGVLSDAIDAIEYAVAQGVRVSNNSWGYYGPHPSIRRDHDALRDAIEAAQAGDHLFVAAAGNDAVDTDTTPHYPSSFELDNVVSVGATDNLDALASFSNFGAVSVDLAAPGDYIMSTYVLYEDQYDDFAWSSGTSMAAPHVAGAAGLIIGLQPDWTYQQIKARLLESVRPVAALDGTSVSDGLLHLPTAIAGLSTAPPAIEVDVDVLPSDSANVVFPNKTGELPVAVLSSAEFDVTQIDPVTLRFGPAEGAPVGAAEVIEVDDLHGVDMKLLFRVEESGIACEDTEVTLSGETYAGEQVTGTDTIDATQCEETGCHAY